MGGWNCVGNNFKRRRQPIVPGETPSSGTISRYLHTECYNTLCPANGLPGNTLFSMELFDRICRDLIVPSNP